MKSSMKQMNKEEAKKIVAAELKTYRAKPYEELAKLIDAPICYEKVGASGPTYQIEIEAFWDDKPNGDIRIVGSVDDGGWRAFAPLTYDFIKSPTGEFIDE